MLYTRTQYIILVLCLLVMLFSGMVYSLIAPFYPAEAARKGLTPAEYGIVFGIYEIVTCIFGIIFGKYTTMFGYKFISVSGWFLIACTTVLFGFLNEVYRHDLFFIFSLLIRILQGVGQAGINTGILTFLTLEFPAIGATVVAFTESLFGTGMALGPTIGGICFDLSGFMMPFVVVGSISLVLAPLLFIFMKSENKETENEVLEENEDVSILKVIRIPAVWIGIVAGTSCITNQGFLAANLEPHLSPLHLSGFSVGLVFFSMSLVYTFCGPVFGWINDKQVLSPNRCILIGAIMLCLGFLLLGPINQVYGPPDLVMIIPAMILVGIGTSAQVISTLIHIKDCCWNSGLKQSTGYNGLISGIWVSMLHFGGFIGPSVGGILYQEFGFSVSCVILVLFNGSILIATVLYDIFARTKAPHSAGEVQPLIDRKLSETNRRRHVSSFSGTSGFSGVFDVHKV